jgi:hypothetical protein
MTTLPTEVSDVRDTATAEWVQRIFDDPAAQSALSIEDYIKFLQNLTPEMVAIRRARVYADAVRPGRPLPPGKTLEDVVVGQWPGDETEEEIHKALKELS